MNNPLNVKRFFTQFLSFLPLPYVCQQAEYMHANASLF